MVESVIRRPAIASVWMDGQDHRVNFYAHSANLDATALSDATAKTVPVVTVRQEDASVFQDGVGSIVKNLVPVDTLGRNARILASVRMERFVMRLVDIVLVSQGGEGRSVIDRASKATTANTARKVAVAPTPNPVITSQAAVNAPKATPVTLAPNSVQMVPTEKTVPINATVETTPSVMPYPESASANQDTLDRTAKVVVCRGDSAQTAISCALVRMEGSATLLVDPVSAHQGI